MFHHQCGCTNLASLRCFFSQPGSPGSQIEMPSKYHVTRDCETFTVTGQKRGSSILSSSHVCINGFNKIGNRKKKYYVKSNNKTQT